MAYDIKFKELGRTAGGSIHVRIETSGDYKSSFEDCLTLLDGEDLRASVMREVKKRKAMDEEVAAQSAKQAYTPTTDGKLESISHAEIKDTEAKESLNE